MEQELVKPEVIDVSGILSDQELEQKRDIIVKEPTKLRTLMSEAEIQAFEQGGLVLLNEKGDHLNLDDEVQEGVVHSFVPLVGG